MTSDLRATFTQFIDSTWISYSTTNLLKMLDLLLHEVGDTRKIKHKLIKQVRIIDCLSSLSP